MNHLTFKFTRANAVDLVERAAATFGEAFAATLIVTPHLTTAALIAAAGAGLSAVKALVKAQLPVVK